MGEYTFKYFFSLIIYLYFKKICIKSPGFNNTPKLNKQIKSILTISFIYNILTLIYLLVSRKYFLFIFNICILYDIVKTKRSLF